jgi:naphtho-gamma-pyrone polyketide synthase
MDNMAQPTVFVPPIPNTMQSCCQVFVFGDLTVAFAEDLRQLLHVKDNPTLRSFFEQVSAAFRAEFGKLPAHQQAWFPRFTTIVDLLSKLGETEGTPALNFTLLCLTELAQFIRYEHKPQHPIVENDPNDDAQIFWGRIETLSQCC